MILRLCLFEMKLSELLDLQNLTQGNQQTILPQLPIMKGNLARTRERIGIVRFSSGLEASFELTLNHPFGAAGLGNNLIGLDILKRHIHREWRVFRLWLHRKTTGDIAAADVRRDFREI